MTMADNKGWKRVPTLGRVMLSITVVCFFIGLLLTVQLRAQKIIMEAKTGRATVEDLTVTLIQIRKTTDSLETEAKELRESLRKYREGENTRKIITQELEKTKKNAGIIALEGPGIEIWLNDSPLAAQSDTWRQDNLAEYFIHDIQIRDLVNTLWNAGAEAITINDQRLIATSEIQCIGSTISVNREYLGPPFVIRAIGDPKELQTALTTSWAFVTLKDWVQLYGLVMEVTTKDNITIAPYRGSLTSKYLNPVVKASGGV